MSRLIRAIDFLIDFLENIKLKLNKRTIRTEFLNKNINSFYMEPYSSLTIKSIEPDIISYIKVLEEIKENIDADKQIHLTKNIYTEDAKSIYINEWYSDNGYVLETNKDFIMWLDLSDYFLRWYEKTLKHQLTSESVYLARRYSPYYYNIKEIRKVILLE